jgi:membrane protein YdbS with pleckstrin-like domain
MDETTNERFKWKFYVLTIMLNLIVLIAACAVIGFFLAPKPYNIGIAAILLLVVLVLSIYFIKRYHVTKKWLNQQHE